MLTLDTTKYLTNLGENGYNKSTKIVPAAMLSCVKDLYANRVDGVLLCVVKTDQHYLPHKAYPSHIGFALQ